MTFWKNNHSYIPFEATGKAYPACGTDTYLTFGGDMLLPLEVENSLFPLKKYRDPKRMLEDTSPIIFQGRCHVKLRGCILRSPGRLTWNINHPFRKDNGLPNLHDYANLQRCSFEEISYRPKTTHPWCCFIKLKIAPSHETSQSKPPVMDMKRVSMP